METEKNSLKSIADEVQASAQISDQEEIIPQPKGFMPLSLQDEAGKWEISVVAKHWYEWMMAKTEGETGDAFIPFGGGHQNKIILFGSDKDENQLPKSQLWINWAMGLADDLARSMNNENHPMPVEDEFQTYAN